MSFCVRLRHSLAGAAALLTATLSLAAGAQAQQPRVRILEPAPGTIVATTFTVRMMAEQLAVEPAGPVRPGSGHMHILVDTPFVEPGQAIPFDAVHMHYGQGQLEAQVTIDEPGRHTLRLQFADGQHVALAGEEFTDTIEVIVAENMILEPADGSTVPPRFPVRMAVSGLRVEPAGPVNQGAGHLHILVDTPFVEPGRAIPFDALHMHYGQGQLEAQLELAPGPHTLRMQFADGEHVALDGLQYRDQIQIVVSDSAAPGSGGAADGPQAPGMPTAPSGERQYTQLCAGCHGDDGRGLAPFPSVLRDLGGRGALVTKIDSSMPPGRGCQGDCAEQVADYILASFDVGSVPGGVAGGPRTPDPRGGTGDPAAADDDALPRMLAGLDCGAPVPGPRALRLLTRREYEATTRDLLGVQTPLTANQPVAARVLGYDNGVNANVVTPRHLDSYLASAADLAERAVRERRDALLSCDPGDRDGCSRRFIQEFGLRAYRRPLDDSEQERMREIFASASSFDEGMELVIRTMLVSPNFLYRTELGTPAGDGTFRLTQYETASALSYLFLGTMPDGPLFEAAAAERLRRPEDRVAEARRLLGDPRARTQIGLFAGQWLGADPEETGEKDADVFPNYTRAVQQAADEELVRFMSHVFFEGTGRFPELYDADYVFVNEPLARFYGLQGVGGQEFQQVPVPDGTRGGVLGLGSVLASYAQSDDSSPVKRGVFVRERLLCHDLPPPPPTVNNAPPGLDPTKSTRERFASHSNDPFCASCHQYIDDIGFGLERYNGAGEFRQQENGAAIDDSGEIISVENFDPLALQLGQTGTPFSGLRELSDLVGSSEDAPLCLTTQYLRFARGLVETDADLCTINELYQSFAQSEFDLRELMLAVVRAPVFTLRRDVPEEESSQ